MKVTLRVAGGLAPSVTGRQLVVDAETLGPADRQRLSEAVDAALAAPPRPSNPSARDARGYEITVESADGAQTIEAEDGAMPPPVRTLIDTVTALARRP